MAGFSGMILYAQLDAMAFGLPFPLFAGILYAGIVGVSSLLICAVVPGLRHMIELVAVSRLLLAIVGLAIPALGIAVITSPLLSATLVVGGAALVRALLLGRTSAGRVRVAERRTTITKRTRHSFATLDAMIAASTHQGTLVTSLRESFRKLPGGASAREAVEGLSLEDVEIRDLGDTREVRLVITRPEMPLHLWISGWIDDAFGLATDRAIPAFVPGRANVPPPSDAALVP